MYQNKVKKYTNKISFRAGSSNQENTWNCRCGTVNQNGMVHCKQCNAPEPLRLGGQEPSTPVSLFDFQEGESPLTVAPLTRIVIPPKEKAYLVGNETAQAVGYNSTMKPFKSYSPNEVDLRNQESWEVKNAAYIKKIEEDAKKELERRQQEETKPQKKYPNSPHLVSSGANTAIPELELEEDKKQEENKQEKPKNESCIIF